MTEQTKSIFQVFGVQWIFIFSLCLLVRLPYFLGPHYYFDGDEAIVGIMAQDLLRGENLPVFFYGQQYGFAFFEVIGVAMGILFLGNTIFALKFGSLLVFSIGATFLFRLLVRSGWKFGWALLAIVIVLLFPGWLTWGAKPRGGYVTAFSLSCILLYIVQLKKATAKRTIISCVLLSLLVHSQLFIALVIIPVWLGWFFRDKKIRLFLLALPVAGVCYFLLKLTAWQNENYWSLPLSDVYHFSLIFPFIKKIPVVFLGHFYYEMSFTPPLLCLIGGGIYFVSLVLIVGWSVLKTQGFIRSVFYLLAIGMWTSFMLIFTMKIPTYRYLLGVETGLVLMIALAFSTMAESRLRKRLLLVILPVAILTGFYSCHVPDSWMLPGGNDVQLYTQLKSELDKKEIRHVFTTDALLQWMLSYHGIPARYTSAHERTDVFLTKVNACHQDTACKTAIVGFTGFYIGMDQLPDWPSRVVIVNNRFFIIVEPDATYLERAGFMF